MTIYGVTTEGFVLKRLNDILTEMAAALNAVVDPATGETLILDLADENDPLVQIVHAVSDQISVCWEQLQICYNQHDPLKATGDALSGMVQLNSLIRQLNETDTVLRSRQQLSTEKTSRGMIEDIFANIYNLPGVTFCRVYQNTSNGVDTRGLAAKSIAAVVVGGNGIDIARVLFQQAPAGIQFHGNTQVFCGDNQGFQHPVNYTIPTEIPIYVIVNLTVVDSNLWTTNSTQNIIDAITSYAESGASSIGITEGFVQTGFIPGLSVYASELYVPANIGMGVKITSIKVGVIPNPTGDVAEIAWNEQASIIASNITVTVS